jgi:hypothetical protein
MRPIINKLEKLEFRAPILIPVTRQVALTELGANFILFDVSPRLVGAPIKQIGASAIKTLKKVHAEGPDLEHAINNGPGLRPAAQRRQL